MENGDSNSSTSNASSATLVTLDETPASSALRIGPRNCDKASKAPKLSPEAVDCSVLLLRCKDEFIELAINGMASSAEQLAQEAEKKAVSVFKTDPSSLKHRKVIDVSSSDEENITRRRKPAVSSDDTNSVSSDSSSSSESESFEKKKAGSKPLKNESKRKLRKRKRIVDSDSVKSTQSESSSDESVEEKPEVGKPRGQKRRRIVREDSSEDESDDDQKKKKKKNESPSKGRKNIKKIIDDSKLAARTKDANIEERERLKRIEEKQKLYNEIITTDTKKVTEKRIVLDFDPKTKVVTVEVDPILCENLKAHQVEGVKFLWNCMIESVDQLKKPDSGSGCILAHSMGLGKTLQVITFLHTLLTNEHTNSCIKKCAIVCPVNTVRNWTNEFYLWLSDNDLLDFPIFEASDCKTVTERKKLLQQWMKNGGVLIIGIPMFSLMVEGGRGKKVNKKVQEVYNAALVDPGPDIIICDEGHLMKNEKTLFNQACSKVRTRRRAILTGTPLQNNLSEYHVMAQFVKPNLLGSKKEFTNRFVNPITNGQCADSTEGDVMLMKKRVHVLHKLLDGCVQRFDYGVLAPYLQPKCEYVLNIQLTPTQIKLYQLYLDEFCNGSRFSLLADYNAFRLIWNHPYLLYQSFRKQRMRLIDDRDEEDSLKDFIASSSSDSESSDSSSQSDTDLKILNGSDDEPSTSGKKASKESIVEVSKKWKTRSRGGDLLETVEESKPVDEAADAWFRPYITPEDYDNISLSGKMILLFEILEHCERIGDKVLIFSQSLPLLDLIEDCLAAKMNKGKSKSLKIVPDSETEEEEEEKSDVKNTWVNGIDYFRIDGSVESASRKKCIDKFNNPHNYRCRLFLLSTKAGSLGINLVGANRCIIFDASWNPTHDIQAIFRVYRFGQTKPVYIYRFLAQGTMEEKIYDRQVMKQSLSCRVIDEQQIERHFKASDIAELYSFTPDTNKERPIPLVPKDRLLADILQKHSELIVSYHEHDSLLENKPDEDLTAEERKAAWQEFEEEKDEELQRKKREELLQQQRAEMFKQQMQMSADRAMYYRMLQESQALNNAFNVQFNSSKTSVTINSNPAGAANTGFDSTYVQSAQKPFSTYDCITVEELFEYFQASGMSRHMIVNRILFELNQGLKVTRSQVDRYNKQATMRQLTHAELIHQYNMKKTVQNLETQLRRVPTFVQQNLQNNESVVNDQPNVEPKYSKPSGNPSTLESILKNKIDIPVEELD